MTITPPTTVTTAMTMTHRCFHPSAKEDSDNTTTVVILMIMLMMMTLTVIGKTASVPFPVHFTRCATASVRTLMWRKEEEETRMQSEIRNNITSATMPAALVLMVVVLQRSEARARYEHGPMTMTTRTTGMMRDRHHHHHHRRVLLLLLLLPQVTHQRDRSGTEKT